MPPDDGSDESDWFDKDEDEMIKDLQTKVNANKIGSVEYISTGITETDEYLKEKALIASSLTQTENTKKITTVELRKISQMELLDAFLATYTHKIDFFDGQISHTDSQDRILLYLHILTHICSLELTGFHTEILQNFAKNDVLLEQLSIIATKMLSKKYDSMWKDVTVVDKTLGDIQSLIGMAHKYNLLRNATNALHMLQHMKKLLETSDSPTIRQRQVCNDLLHTLKTILQDLEEESVAAKNQDIYPTLEELLTEQRPEIQMRKTYNNVEEYVEQQKLLLREDFMISLRECVNALKQNKTVKTLNFFDDVFIIPNEGFLEAYRHEMIFVDVLGSRRIKSEIISKTLQSKMLRLKTGALFCFSSSRQFNDFILATMKFTDVEMLKKGYIGIEIVRQYNIGNFYNKQLFMFESPAFFEPYNNVYSLLNGCTITDFPMKRYIVFGEHESRPPVYLHPDTVYNCDKQSFRPLTDPAPKELPLNESQLSAYNKALTQEFSLIQGPPGTGKTHLSVHLVRTLIENAKTPILLITYTNELLDKFLVKLSDYTDNIARFGNQTRLPEIAKFNIREAGDKEAISPQLKQLYYLLNLEHKAQFQRLQAAQSEFDGTDESYEKVMAAQQTLREINSKLDTTKILFQFYLGREKAIIAMTTTCAAKTNFLFRLLKCSIVVFEEAAEVLESHVVACLTPQTQHVIMIGDHMQLKPYTSTYQHSRTYELNVSLFERLIRNNMQPSVLLTQYRMRPSIAELLCPTIYEELHNGEVVETYPPVRNMGKNLYFMTHEQNEERHEDESSARNIFECDEIVKLAKHLVCVAEYAEQDIVVLSPYAKQIEHIRRSLQLDASLKQIKAMTVDSFQGLESCIILLSLVRSNANGQIGFLKEQNRICVALSRAKHGLYMIGNLKLLADCSKTWASVMEKLMAQEAVGDEFPYVMT